MDAEDIINPADFKSIQIRVEMENTTTHTKVKQGELNTIQFLEFVDQPGDDGVVLDVPSNACAKGHNVLVHLQTENSKESLDIQFSAKVTQVQALENKRQAIHLDLVQYDKRSWRAFKDVFSGRQKEIESFFKAVKGI